MPYGSASLSRAISEAPIVEAFALLAIIMQVTVPELESAFRQVPIIGRHISTHLPAAELQHSAFLEFQDSRYRIATGTSVASTVLHIQRATERKIRWLK